VWRRRIRWNLNRRKHQNPSAQERTGSLLAAEKRTLEMIANGASLSEVLNDLCAAIDAHAPAATTMVCLMDLDGKQLFPRAGPHVPRRIYDGHHTLADWSQQRFLRHRRVYETTSDHSGYFQRSAMAR